MTHSFPTRRSSARVLAAGVDVVRLNFSHGTAEDQQRRAEQVRREAHKLGIDIGILADLQGPKIRIESFAAGPVTLQEAQRFTLDTALDAQAGDASVVGCAYTEFPQDVAPGDVRSEESRVGKECVSQCRLRR